MGTEVRYTSVFEARRLLWLVAFVFVMVLMIQYFGFPYVNVVPSLFSPSKGQVAFLGSYQTGESSAKASVSGNTSSRSDIPEVESSGINSSVSETEFVQDMTDGIRGVYVVQGLANNETIDANPSPTPAASLPPVVSPYSTFPHSVDSKIKVPLTSSIQNQSTIANNEKHENLQSHPAPSVDHSCESNIPVVVERSDRARNSVASVSQMNDMLQKSRTSFCSMKPRWSSVVDQELLRAKALIENAPLLQNEPGLYAPLYRNLSMFKRSYELMEQILKVYIYAEGEKPVFHTGPLGGIYASEGWFMKLLQDNKNFVTKNPEKAHLYYLPISFRLLKLTLYVPDSHNRTNIIQFLSNYVDMITQKYRFWNRTGGADHFIVASHDWAPAETNEIMANCIRSLCNADLRGGFQFGKDVSLPQPNLRLEMNPLAELGGKPASKRRTLAFFAGNMHGYLRPILLKYWGNKDSEMKISGPIKKASYVQYMKNSKYCICARGYQVNTPRVVEAIYYGCVPVVLSDNYVPPLFETLNWESFAVFVLEKDIPSLKSILVSIPEKRYRTMQRRVKQVQKHFLWHVKPFKYDVFHMILHSIWHNRVFGVTLG